MKFETENWGGASFSVPDQPSVFEIVEYDSARFGVGELPSMLVLWNMAKTILTDWQSEALPDPRADLKEVTDARAARVIEWAGVQVSTWRRGLDELPKN